MASQSDTVKKFITEIVTGLLGAGAVIFSIGYVFAMKQITALESENAQLMTALDDSNRDCKARVELVGNQMQTAIAACLRNNPRNPGDCFPAKMSVNDPKRGTFDEYLFGGD